MMETKAKTTAKKARKKNTKKDADTRLRLLLVEQILREVGEGEYITTKEIQKILKDRYDVECEVKAIYGDIKAINDTQDKLSAYRNKMLKKKEKYGDIEVPPETGMSIDKHQRRGYSVYDYTRLDEYDAMFFLDCMRTSPFGLYEEEIEEKEDILLKCCDARARHRLKIGKKVSGSYDGPNIDYSIVQKINMAVVDEDVGYVNGKVYKMKLIVGEQATEIVPLDIGMGSNGVLWLDYYDCEAEELRDISLEQVSNVIELQEIVDYYEYERLRWKTY